MSPVPRGARLALVAALSALVPAAFAGSAAADVNADHLSNVPNAQPKVLGRPVPNKLSRELAEIPQASGADLSTAPILRSRRRSTATTSPTRPTR